MLKTNDVIDEEVQKLILALSVLWIEENTVRYRQDFTAKFIKCCYTNVS